MPSATALRRRLRTAIKSQAPPPPTPAPPFRSDPAGNLTWNRWRWGDAQRWKTEDRFGYRWSGGIEQPNNSPNKVVERFITPHLLGGRDLTILEIGSGAGRLAGELVGLSSSLHLVDLNPACTELCRERFRYYPHVTCHTNDGRSLDVVGDTRFDLIVTFESMAHVAPEIALGYIDEAAAKLVDGGVLVFDHSLVEDTDRCRTAISLGDVTERANRQGLVLEEHYERGTDHLTVLRKGVPRTGGTETAGTGVDTFRTRVRVVDRELDAALKGTSAWNETRIPVIRSTFIKMLRSLDVPTSDQTSAPILEIGADGQLASAKALHRLSGLPVVATNLTVDGLAERVGDYDIEVRVNRIGALDFPDESFSMIFGRSVLEHISDLEDFLRECHRVLQPGGVMYIDGGAFWPSPKGHHMAVKGADGTHYGFDVMPDLIDPWFHICSDEHGLREHLLGKDIPPADAEIISHYIHTSPEQNRMAGSEIIAAFQAPLFRTCTYECTFVDDEPPEAAYEHYSRFDLKCHGISFCVTK